MGPLGGSSGANLSAGVPVQSQPPCAAVSRRATNWNTSVSHCESDALRVGASAPLRRPHVSGKRLGAMARAAITHGLGPTAYLGVWRLADAATCVSLPPIVGAPQRRSAGLV